MSKKRAETTIQELHRSLNITGKHSNTTNSRVDVQGRKTKEIIDQLESYDHEDPDLGILQTLKQEPE